ncbi:MAG: hypothetical protein CMH31_01985 [Micavibrio sp.]|nr:hypothetical protein [Micavibrio sp.]|tara:strand:- start:483 stop:1031 length:549 start_codon:yes stop_codon:yes gene_type:complete
MSTTFRGITTVIFNASALFYEDETGIQAMPHIREVLEFLKSKNIHLVSCFKEGDDPQTALNVTGLEDLFTTEGNLQAIYVSQETDRAKELNLRPLTYYNALKAIGVDDMDSVATIAGHYEEIKEARASSIQKVIGFYGSPTIPLGQVQAYKSNLERDVTALAGTKLTTANLREIPEYIGPNL